MKKKSLTDKILHSFWFGKLPIFKAAAAATVAAVAISAAARPIGGPSEKSSSKGEQWIVFKVVPFSSILETKLSVLKNICTPKTLTKIKNIYLENDLDYTYKNYSKKSSITNLIPYLKNDKKNNDDKVNFLLLKRIGVTALPNKNKISVSSLKKLSKTISQY